VAVHGPLRASAELDPLSDCGTARHRRRSRAGLERRLGHVFADPRLLEMALRHRSVAAGVVRARAEASNERLEFLGDRVLGLILAHALIDRYPDASEGTLTPRLTTLVRTATLAEIAKEIGLGDDLLVGGGEAQGAVRANPGTLADTLEAVLAAVYLDAGLDAARTLVERLWGERISRAADAPREPKAALQEWAQARGLPRPSYRVLAQDGPPHQPRFTVEAVLDGHGRAEASGASKRSAEQAAAAALLVRLTERAA
jgi:ribonuclease-3